MLKVKSFDLEPVKVILMEADPSGETFMVIRRATFNDEARRFSLIWDGQGDTALVTRIAAVEIFVSLVECNILDENDKSVLDPALPFDEFEKRLTYIWAYNPVILWEMQRKVHEVNPRWGPSENP